jgi:predicted O-methyltransferase YrrM
MTQAFNELVSKIHLGDNPYDGFPVEAWQPEDPHVWDSRHEWFHKMIDELRPRIIIEVGSFKGGSAIHMATRLKELGLDAAIVCVDTWLADKWLWLDPYWKPHLHFAHGRPDYYNVFMRNVIEAGLTEYIVPLPMPSQAAARMLFQLDVSAQMVYIDGSHERRDVYLDLQNYYDNLLDKGGVMLMDDVDFANPMFEGLICDLTQFVVERHMTFSVLGRKAAIRK